MLFITSRLPTVNTEPELNKDFVFDLGNNSSSRGFFFFKEQKQINTKRPAAKLYFQELKTRNTSRFLFTFTAFRIYPKMSLRMRRNSNLFAVNKKDKSYWFFQSSGLAIMISESLRTIGTIKSQQIKALLPLHE